MPSKEIDRMRERIQEKFHWLEGDFDVVNVA